MIPAEEAIKYNPEGIHRRNGIVDKQVPVNE